MVHKSVSSPVAYKCKKCGDEIAGNTHKQLISCQCGAMAVDGDEHYARVVGDPKDYQEI
jgi:hypothetical protein